MTFWMPWLLILGPWASDCHWLGDLDSWLGKLAGWKVQQSHARSKELWSSREATPAMWGAIAEDSPDRLANSVLRFPCQNDTFVSNMCLLQMLFFSFPTTLLLARDSGRPRSQLRGVLWGITARIRVTHTQFVHIYTVCRDAGAPAAPRSPVGASPRASRGFRWPKMSAGATTQCAG